MASSCCLALACFALVAAAASATTQFRVGGEKGWSVPDATAEPYNAWAGRMRFQIGDQLLFVYPKETDSVLLVEAGAYNGCNTTSYVQKFDDGNTVFTFDRSGPFFFISGNEANCRANEKLIVVVLASRTPPPAVSPSPSSMPPPSPPSMPPPSAAPMPSPPAPPTMPTPSGAPMPSPSTSPPSGAPMPAPAATPESAPSPTGSAPGPAPTATPGSPPSPAAMAPSPSSSPPSPPALAPSPSSSPDTPGGGPQPPSASGNQPGAEGANSTTPPGSGAATMAAGLTCSLAAIIGYAMLAI